MSPNAHAHLGTQPTFAFISSLVKPSSAMVEMEGSTRPGTFPRLCPFFWPPPCMMPYITLGSSWERSTTQLPREKMRLLTAQSSVCACAASLPIIDPPCGEVG